MKNTIVITGASRGIGLALAEHYLSLGHPVVASARTSGGLALLEERYPNLRIVLADVTEGRECEKIKSAILPNETGIVLIHNAGMAVPEKITLLSASLLNQHLQLNVMAPLYLTQLLLPHLNNHGRVVMISSKAAHLPTPGMGPYAISKAALHMLKKCLNTEGIACASIQPGVVDTQMQTNLRNYSIDKFPAVQTFQGFWIRHELLAPQTAAKFIAWVISQEKDSFCKNKWNIYDTSHHPFWASSPEEVVQRQPTPQEGMQMAKL